MAQRWFTSSGLRKRKNRKNMLNKCHVTHTTSPQISEEFISEAHYKEVLGRNDIRWNYFPPERFGGFQNITWSLGWLCGGQKKGRTVPLKNSWSHQQVIKNRGVSAESLIWLELLQREPGTKKWLVPQIVLTTMNNSSSVPEIRHQRVAPWPSARWPKIAA